MRAFHKTPKGTELPLLNLRGREYLEVKFRIVWFREDHSDWSIETQLLNVTEQSAFAKATVKDDAGRVIATSHKFETKKGFPDFIEKAETGAIGRALALIGYGTQFCADELDEGKRVVDGPVEEPALRPASGKHSKTAPSVEVRQPKDPGDYVITFGKKYKGVKLRDVPRTELEGYMEWLEENAAKKGLPISEEARFLKVAITRFFEGEKKSERAPVAEGLDGHELSLEQEAEVERMMNDMRGVGRMTSEYDSAGYKW